jgi:lon-related putative ATP-dependent protease
MAEIQTRVVAYRLQPEQLTSPCDPAQFDFETTEGLPPLETTIGQPRAMESLDFALAVRTAGYNLYVAGQPGTGRNSTLLQRLRERAAGEPVPSDWCYVFNFNDPYRPVALSLPPGQGARLAQAMRGLVAACRREIPRAFEGEHYEQRRNSILQRFEETRHRMLHELEQYARERGFAVELTPAGILTMPLQDGRPMAPEQFAALPDFVRAAIEARGQELQQEINRTVSQIRRLEKQALEALRALDQEIARFVVHPLVEEVREQFDGLERVQAYLDAVEQDLIERHDLFLHLQQHAEAHAARGMPLALSEEDLFARYEVNVVVDHTGARGAPVIVEHNPTYYNLIGRIDYTARFGGMVTDHRFIKAGAILRASGGYLVVQARDLLASPFAWDALKRALRTQQVALENLGEQYTPIPTATLKPEPIPVNLKVVIVGDRLVYQLLYLLDEDFQKLFKARADFDTVTDRTPEAERAYALFLAHQSRDRGLLPFDRTAVARVVEHGARLAGHQRKLSTRFNEIVNLAAESSHWARQAGRLVVTAEDVERAIEHRIFRSNLIEERLQELIRDGTLLIQTEGAVVGQVNGLSVVDLGDYAFGHPSRITARVAPGNAGVVNIEREIRQSGPAHSKGVLILAGYILGQYAAEAPLTLSASLGFEQVYELVDGDSASSAELYALLSALAEVPLRQDLAVTGSVNQLGQVQAIGGVNEKIEGFFAVCRMRGLTGTHGVIIPRANVQHLMLRRDVIEAVRQGQFHIYAIDHVDQGLELLTGMPAGQRAPDGTYPADTVHGRVAARLRAFAKRMVELRALATGDGRETGRSSAEASGEGEGAGSAGLLSERAARA